ncbi:MAG: DMT family transporter [Thermoleophilia bacterium]|nr:DMT family transporter [Thermoleophilia bacterium]
MGIGLGLAAALCWGFADYFATLASRRTGAVRTVLGFHLAAIAVLAVVVAATGALDGLTGEQALVLAGVGAIGWVSYLGFYRALAIGPISIVSPIVSGYAVVAVILAVLLLGERLGGGEVAAVLVVFGGVALASIDPRVLRVRERVQILGIALAVLTMFSIGAFVFGVSYYSDELGWLGPIFLGRVFTGALIALTAARGGQWRFPDRSPATIGLIGTVAGLDTAGYVAFNVGVQQAETSLVATAAAPYAVVPIVLGVAVLRERPAPLQWLGVALVIGGLVLLGLAS